jgi:hypothetical protein
VWTLALEEANGRELTTALGKGAHLSSESDTSDFRAGGQRVAIDTLIVLGLTIGLGFLHLWVAGPVPSGGDGGNWLALAHDLLGREVVAPGVSYPPVFTSMLALLLLIWDPVPAVVIASIIARSICLSAVYMVMRGFGRTVALITATASGLAAFQLESYAWGAYPQILGQGLGLIATYFGVRYAVRPNRRFALLAVAAAAGTVLTHTLVAALLVIALVVAAAHAAFVSGRVRRNWLRGLMPIAFMVVTIGLYLAVEVLRSEGSAVLNPADLSIRDGLNLAMGESPIPWLVVTGIGITSLLHRHWLATQSIAVSVGAGWFLAGAGLFLATGERRSLLAAQLGVILLASAQLTRWWRKSRDRGRVVVGNALLVFSAALVGSIAVPGMSDYRESTSFYRIVDTPEVEALQFLEESAEVGDTVLASRGRNTIPIGWWVEGIARLPTISGHDPRYLTFPAEILEAEEANAFFAGELEPIETTNYLNQAGVRFVVVDKRGPDSGWLFRADRPTFPVIYDSSALVILEVRDQ